MSVDFITVFLAGLLTFFAPCVLPVYPMYLSYITGISIKELDKKSSRKKVLVHSVFFVLGFSSIFMMIGFSTNAVSSFIYEYSKTIGYISGALLIFMGLFLSGIIQPQKLFKEVKWKPKKRNVGFINSFMIGLGLGGGWSPCIGPVLAAVYAITLTNPDQAFALLLVYQIGFGIPFIVLSFFLTYISKLNKYMGTIQKITGVIFIIMGVIMITGHLQEISLYLTAMFGEKWF